MAKTYDQAISEAFKPVELTASELAVLALRDIARVGVWHDRMCTGAVSLALREARATATEAAQEEARNIVKTTLTQGRRLGDPARAF